MPIPDETLKAIIRDYQGFELTDEELALVQPEIEFYLSELALWEDLDLSAVLSSRLMRVPESVDRNEGVTEGGAPNG